MRFYLLKNPEFYSPYTSVKGVLHTTFHRILHMAGNVRNLTEIYGLVKSLYKYLSIHTRSRVWLLLQKKKREKNNLNPLIIKLNTPIIREVTKLGIHLNGTMRIIYDIVFSP